MDRMEEGVGDKAIVTYHAFLRGKERLGLSKKAVKRTAQIALDTGTPRTEWTGSFRRYLDKLFYSHGRADLIVYGHHIYVFNQTILITVLEVPREYVKIARKGRRP